MTPAEVEAIFASMGQDVNVHFSGEYEEGRAERLAASGISAEDLRRTLATAPATSPTYSSYRVTEYQRQLDLFKAQMQAGQQQMMALFSQYNQPPPAPPPEPELTFEEARLELEYLFPAWSPVLLDVFANEWVETGDADLALARTRASEEFDQAFPGLKRDDGSLRMTESDYLSAKEMFDVELLQIGVNPDYFGETFVELVGGEVSPREMIGRVESAYSQVIDRMPELQQHYATQSGLVELTPEAIIASFLDPRIGEEILNRRIAVSEIAAEASIRSLEQYTNMTTGIKPTGATVFPSDRTAPWEQPGGGMVGPMGERLLPGQQQGEAFAPAGATGGGILSVAERLYEAGISTAEARQTFGEAAQFLPILNILAKRHFDPDDDFDLTEFTNAQIFDDPTQRRRMRGLLLQERSSFTNRSGFGLGAQGQVSGILAR